MRRVFAKVAHTLEPGCIYVQAGTEVDIQDHQFDENVHAPLRSHREPTEPAHVTIPAGVDTPPRPTEVPNDLQFSTPPKADWPTAPAEYDAGTPIAPQADAVESPAHDTPSVAPTPAQPSDAPLSPPSTASTETESE